MAKRKKRENWGEDAARAELAAWRGSGLSMAEHCRRRGIRPKRLYWWKRRLEAGGRLETIDSEAPLRWVEAAITSAGTSAAVAVVLRGGDRIEVERPSEVEAAWLARVVACLRRGS